MSAIFARRWIEHDSPVSAMFPRDEAFSKNCDTSYCLWNLQIFKLNKVKSLTERKTDYGKEGHSVFRAFKASKCNLRNKSRAFQAQWDIKQLLDEVEHDIMNYQNLVSVLSAEAIKTSCLCYLWRSRRLQQITQTRGFANSWYHAKTEFNNCFVIHFLHNSSSQTEAKRSAILFLRRTLQGA